jgi:AmmeMemoRadiSam system protein A
VSETNQELEALNPVAAEAAVKIARQSLEFFLRKNVIFHPDLSVLPAELAALGSSFVTITNRGRLRGCMGNTEARYALATDIARNAVSAASRDYRFSSVKLEELIDVRLEVTILTIPVALPYRDYNDLLGKLEPGVHGVILTSGKHKGLLLPQVWDRLPEADRFLDMIALKAGIPAKDLRDSPPSVDVHTFLANHYSELGYLEPGS